MEANVQRHRSEMPDYPFADARPTPMMGAEQGERDGGGSGGTLEPLGVFLRTFIQSTMSIPISAATYRRSLSFDPPCAERAPFSQAPRSATTSGARSHCLCPRASCIRVLVRGLYGEPCERLSCCPPLGLRHPARRLPARGGRAQARGGGRAAEAGRAAAGHAPVQRRPQHPRLHRRLPVAGRQIPAAQGVRLTPRRRGTFSRGWHRVCPPAPSEPLLFHASRHLGLIER
jgi:hypothetical protein